MYIMLSVLCISMMADSNNGSTVNDIYKMGLSLSEKIRTYYHCKSSPYLLVQV